MLEMWRKSILLVVLLSSPLSLAQEKKCAGCKAKVFYLKFDNRFGATGNLLYNTMKKTKLYPDI
jgi:hypothetical protein